MLERCSSLEGGLSERAKFGFGFALVVALAMTAWIVLTGDPKVDSESRQLAEQGDPRSPSLAAVGEELGQDEGSEAEATRSSVRSLRARSFPARRDELDPFAMPFPFTGRCVANGRSVNGATVHYKGETRTTDEHGRFSFPSYGYALRVVVEAEGFGQLVATSSASRMTLQMQPPAIGRVIVRNGIDPVQGAQVTVFLNQEHVKVGKERTLMRDLPVVGKQLTDAKGFAFFPELPSFDRNENSHGMLYCLIEYPDGWQHEDFLIPRKQAVSRGDPRIEWSRDYGRRGAHSGNLRVETRNEFGNRVPVSKQLVYYRVNPYFFSPWHEDRTDLSGSIPIKEWDAEHMQVLIPISSTKQWSSVTDPLIDLGSHRLALIESAEQSVQLLGAPDDDSIRFQVQRMASVASDLERVPRSRGGLVELSEWGWQDCRPGEFTELTSGWVSKESWVWVRAQPGNRVITSRRLNASGHTDIPLPKLSRFTVRAGDGQRFPLAARVWLKDQSAQRLPPLILDPRGSSSVQGIVPFGIYEVALVLTGMQNRKLGDLRVDAHDQEFTIECPQQDATLTVSLGSHLLSDFALRVDQRGVLSRTNANAELPVRGTQGDSILVQLPASAKLSELELPGRPELIFLGYEVELPFEPGSMQLQVPLGSLFFEAHSQDGGKVRITRRDSADAPAAWVELPLTPGGALLARTLPAGHYRLETDFRSFDVEIKPVGRVQVDADDR
jgi:hypothetical protein